MSQNRAASSFASDADRAVCRQLIKNGSRSFAAASLLLPAAVREDAFALYAFCRLSDDLVDVDGGSMPAIERLRERLALAYAGRPEDSPVDRAFADVIHRHHLPRALPEALIDGLEWDVGGVACETIEDLYAYAARVAAAVGAMMTVLMGVREPRVLARACDLGVAMQLTNVARDVGEDARAGRLYLPRVWLREAGLDPDQWLANPVCGPKISSVIARLLDTAETLYARADAGIGGLPLACRPGIFAARHIYREIGAEVARRGYDSISSRARVPGSQKLRLAGRALVDAWFVSSQVPNDAALPETAYLVDAVTPLVVEEPIGFMADRLLWVAKLFSDLGARDRIAG